MRPLRRRFIAASTFLAPNEGQNQPVRARAGLFVRFTGYGNFEEPMLSTIPEDFLLKVAVLFKLGSFCARIYAKPDISVRKSARVMLATTTV